MGCLKGCDATLSTFCEVYAWPDFYLAAHADSRVRLNYRIASIQQKRGANRGKNKASRGTVSSNRQFGLSSSSYMASTKRRNERKSERTHESIAEISGSAAFTVQESIAINPALPNWTVMSSRVKTYERYDGDYLEFPWVPTKANTYGGLVILAFDYNTLDAPPTSLSQALQASVVARGKAMEHFTLRVPIKHLKGLYTRTGSVANADLKTYDIGKLHVCTYACDDTTAIGELESDFAVRAYEQNPNGLAAAAPLTGSGLSIFNVPTAALLASANLPFLYSEEIVNTLGVTYDSGLFTLPAGNFKVDVQMNGGAMSTQCTLWKDGVKLTGPEIAGKIATAGNSASVTGFIVSDGTTTCSFRNGQSFTPAADLNRIIFTVY